MNALKLQQTSETVHSGARWSWVGVGATAVLILVVLSITMAGDFGETSPPVSGGSIIEVQADVPMAPRDLVLHGRGLVDMPDVATAVGGPASAGTGTSAGSQAEAYGASSGDMFVRPVQARCPAKPGC